MIKVLHLVSNSSWPQNVRGLTFSALKLGVKLLCFSSNFMSLICSSYGHCRHNIYIFLHRIVVPFLKFSHEKYFNLNVQNFYVIRGSLLMEESVGSMEGALGTSVTPLGPNTFIFMQFLAKILHNNRLAQ